MPAKSLVHLLRSSADWVANLPEGPEALDVSGWDQTNFEAAWVEPVSWPEFLNRLWQSKRMQKVFQLDDTGTFIPEKGKK